MTNENLFPALRDGEKTILYHLYAHGAKHVVFGSHAVLLYAPDREVGANDLDVVVECSKENAVKVLAAVQACGAQLEYEPAEYLDRLSRPKSGVNVPYDNGVEIMTSTESEVLSFDDLWRDRCLVSVSMVLPGSWEESIFDVPFVSNAHLVQLKQEAINNPERKKNKEKWEQDIIDLKSLQ
jgi:hypothetical protein